MNEQNRLQLLTFFGSAGTIFSHSFILSFHCAEAEIKRAKRAFLNSLCEDVVCLVIGSQSFSLPGYGQSRSICFRDCLCYFDVDIQSPQTA